MHLSLLVQPPAVGGDPFGIPTSGGERAPSDPFGGGGGSHDNSKTPPSSDPFADPFGSDSFGSAGWSGDSLAATAKLRRKEEEDLARAIKESLKIAKK